MTRLFRLLLVLAAALVAPSTALPAQRRDAIDANLPRVRALDALAANVLDAAIRMSPTVVGLIAELRRGDVIVHVQTAFLPPRVKGVTRLVTATPSARYVRVMLRIPNALPCLVAVLGHELRHAVELAAMPDVRDERAFVAAALEMGWATFCDGFFETKAAVHTGRLVWREIAGK